MRLVQRVATHTSDGARLAACGVSTLLGDGACSILGADAPSSSGARRPPARLSRPHLRPWWNASRSRELFGSPRDSRRCRERTALLPSALLGASLEPRATFRGHRAALYCIIFDKTGRRVVTGSDDHLVKIWSTETGDLMHACRGHRGEIAYLDVNASNELVASASFDFTIRTWFLASGEPCATLVGHGDIVSEARFSPVAPNALLSASWDGTLRLWNAREDSSVAPPVVLDAFSPSGAGAPRRETREENAAAYRSASAAFVASASVAAAAEARGALPDDRDAPPRAVLSCAWSPGGDVFACGSANCEVRAWTLPRREEAKKRTGVAGSLPASARVAGGHLNDVVSAFSASGAFLLTASRDGQAGVGADRRGRVVAPPVLAAPDERRRWRRSMGSRRRAPPRAPTGRDAAHTETGTDATRRDVSDGAGDLDRARPVRRRRDERLRFARGTLARNAPRDDPPPRGGARAAPAPVEP